MRLFCLRSVASLLLLGGVVLALQNPPYASTGQNPRLNNALFKVKLTSPISSKTSQPRQQVMAQVISPVQFQNWFMIGQIDKAVSSGSMKKKSELRFSFQKLTNTDASTQIPIHANITSFTNSKGVQNTDEEGQIVEKRNPGAKAALIGAGAGALIGGLAGGPKGAAIGAGAGAVAGVLVASFGVKGPTISFDAGSQFDVSVTTPSPNAR